jgi:pantetheine-phosphate adenylyltransferase
MKNRAIYAGTFDPITLGHLDLIERASSLVEKVVIGVAASVGKHPLFSLEERVGLVKQALAHCSNVEVFGFSGLLIDFAREQKANVILRGIRAVADVDYEFQLASMNRQMNASIETLFLMPAEKYMYVSASIVREIATMGGDVTGFVPPVVVEALKRKLRS